MSERLAKIPQLDALRTVAATAVILYHFLPELDLGSLPYGWAGVDLFFVLSGFLITAILLKQKEAALHWWPVIKNFVIKRSLRLFPAYFVFLLGFMVLRSVTGLWSWDPGQGIWYFTYTSNILIFIEGPRAGHLTHLWSLAVEEQFYLLWPWLVLFFRGSTLQRLLVLMAVFSFMLKSFSDVPYIARLTIAHFDSLGCGALIAQHIDQPGRLLRWMKAHAGWLVLASLAILAVNANTIHWPILMRGSILLGSTSLLLGGIRGFSGPFGKLLDQRWMHDLGRISYGLYLYHKPIPLLLTLAATRLSVELPGYFLLALSLTLTWIAARLSFQFLESPFLRLKSRFDL